MKANSDIAPEIPEADFNEAKVAFEESLGSNFGTASILEEEEEAPTRYDHPRNALIWHRHSGHLDGRWCRRDHLSFQVTARIRTNLCRGYA